MPERIELEGRVGKDYHGYLFVETNPPSWKFRAISEKLTNAGYTAGQEIIVAIKPVKKDT